jgi:hypothetical protein
MTVSNSTRGVEDTQKPQLGHEVVALVETRERRHALVVGVAVCVGLFGMLLAAYARYLEPARPGVLSAKGFFGFFDQGQYLNIARLLAGGHIPSRSQYTYGLGYPILAAPFIRLGFHGDPFAPVDVLAFGTTLALTFLLGFRAAAKRTLRAALFIGLGAALIVACASPALGLNSQPWNSNVVTPLGLLVLVIATSEREITVGRSITLGIAVGWIFATRYLDAVFLGLPVLALFVVRSTKERKRIALFGGLALAAVMLPVLASQQYALGSWLNTPYQFHARKVTGGSDQSVNQYRLQWIPTHFRGVFITGLLNGRRIPRDPLLRQFPLLVFAPVGAAFIVAERTRARLVWIATVAGSIIGSLFYLSFIAGGAGDLPFGNARYWAPWYPLWAVLAVLGIERLARSGVDWLSHNGEGTDAHSRNPRAGPTPPNPTGAP